MEGSDYLLTCAEVAAALAGFSALIVALGRQGSDDLSTQYRALVGNLIERSLIAVFLSFLPILLSGLGISPEITWLLSSGTLAGYIVSMAWRSMALRRSDPAFSELVSGPAFTILFSAGMLVLALQLAHAFGLGLQQQVWWYLVGLTWLLASVAYTFYFGIRRWARAA